MPGAPQVGFSATMRKIRVRISSLMRFRPPALLGLESHFQYSRKPARCQPHNCSGCDQDERSFPASPEFSQYHPEKLVRRGESSARSLGVESEHLLTQGKIFEDEILAGGKGTAKPAEEVPEPHDHGKNLIRRRQTASWPTH